MDSTTKGELIENVSGMIGTAMKELFVRRSERKKMEREAQLKKDLAEIRANSTARSEGRSEASAEEVAGVLNSLSEAEEVGEQYDRLLAQAEAAEDCELCKTLIRETRDRPLSEQKALIPELHEFLSRKDDDASQEELVRQLEDSPALLSLIEERVVGADENQAEASPSSETQTTTDRFRADPPSAGDSPQVMTPDG